MKPAAERFFEDPRVGEAKRLVLTALADHQRELTGVRPPEADLRLDYERALAEFNRLRAAPLFFPYLGSGLGRGPLVELADGSVKYDMISGIGVHHLGHSHPLVMGAAFDAALRDTLMQGNLQQDAESSRLARLLTHTANRFGARLEHCFLSTSGAMANENALKLALQARSPASRVLAFERGFAGRTLALSQITDNPKHREGLPAVLPVDYVPFFDARRPEESRRAAVNALEAHLNRYPGHHAVMVMELVQGEAGYYAGDREFFLRLCGILKARKVALCIDEIQTFGRTSRPFAFQHFGLDALVDLVTLGKLTQVCATLFSEEFRPRPGLISQTFTGGSAAIVASRVIVDALLGGDCFGDNGRNQWLQRRFSERLEEIRTRRPDRLAGPFGLGAMVAFTPLDGSAEAAKAVAQALYEEGVIGFTAGTSPTRVRFLPPVPVMTDEVIDAVCAIVERVVTRVR